MAAEEASMHLEKPVYVSDLIVYLLHALGIDYVTLNPGATTRGIHESLVTYGGNQAPEVITCCHEEVAAVSAFCSCTIVYLCTHK